MKRKRNPDYLEEKKAELQTLARNRDLTESKILKIFEILVNDKGYRLAEINELAKRAKVNRRTVNAYFRNKIGLLNALIHTSKLGYKSEEEIDKIVFDNKDENGQDLFIEIIQEYFSIISASPILQEVNRMKITNRSHFIELLIIEREHLREKFFNVAKPYFEGTNVHFNSIAAFLIGGINYIVNYCTTNNSPFCGLNLDDPKDQQHILITIQQMVEWAYTNAKKR